MRAEAISGEARRGKGEQLASARRDDRPEVRRDATRTGILSAATGLIAFAAKGACLFVARATEISSSRLARPPNESARIVRGQEIIESAFGLYVDQSIFNSSDIGSTTYDR